MTFARHLKVLVVDDTTVSRMLVCDGLWSFGVKDVVIAQDGDQAMKMLMQTPCHLIVSDYNMPKMNGIELLKAVRAYAPTKTTGFILVTGKGDKALIDEGRKYGLNNFLLKPFTNDVLRNCLEKVVGKLT